MIQPLRLRECHAFSFALRDDGRTGCAGQVVLRLFGLLVLGMGTSPTWSFGWRSSR